MYRSVKVADSKVASDSAFAPLAPPIGRPNDAIPPIWDTAEVRAPSPLAFVWLITGDNNNVASYFFGDRYEAAPAAIVHIAVTTTTNHRLCQRPMTNSRRTSSSTVWGEGGLGAFSRVGCITVNSTG